MDLTNALMLITASMMLTTAAKNIVEIKRMLKERPASKPCDNTARQSAIIIIPSARAGRRSFRFWLMIAEDLGSLLAMGALLWLFISTPTDSDRWFIIAVAILIVLVLRGRRD